MGYLLMHIWLCLAAAALLGGLLMWLVSKMFSKDIQGELESLWGGKLRDSEARVLSLQTNLKTVIGDLNYEAGYPTKETVEKLYDEMDFQRASQDICGHFPP